MLLIEDATWKSLLVDKKNKQSDLCRKREKMHEPQFAISKMRPWKISVQTNTKNNVRIILGVVYCKLVLL